ncbi:four helix bundle protein [Planctellipticum variicoloris]|jgi:four helix bundle protein|uniref:four helix bundle protein n=1 Tax=Planctellipticum variicoloris TaxID=3064265 RepID=UPI002C125FC3|nr:four helix bundle protein [Planctomycetaceae bacterium SH412]HTN03801.1 four helix bundle protein [Planctomycetaceae bacterium]
MSEPPAKPFDFEERSLQYAQWIRKFLKRLPRTIANFEDAKQLVRASGSVGANYIEANESLGAKDFRHRLRIARKEAKESRYWLKLIDTGSDPDVDRERLQLIQESTELLRILSAMLNRNQNQE